MEKKNHSICVLGSRASGKTCFFASLWHLCIRCGNSDFNSIIGHDETTASYLADNGKAISQGMLPPASTAFIPLKGQLIFKNQFRFDFTSCDFPGEYFQKEFENIALQSHSELIDFCMGSEYILLLLDYEQDVCAQSPECDKRLDSLLNAGIYLNQQNDMLSQSEPSQQQKMLWQKKILLVITKADLYPNEPTPKNACTLLKEKQPNFYRKISYLQGNIPVFFLSSLGEEMAVAQRKNSLETGHKINSGQIVSPNPWGYEKIFQWIIDDIRTPRIHQQRATMFACLAIILVLLGIGKLFVNHQEEGIVATEKIIESYYQDREQPISLLALEEKLKKFEELPSLNSQIEEKLINVKKDISERIDDKNFEILNNTTDLKLKLELIDKYLTNKSFNRHRNECNTQKGEILHKLKITTKRPVNHIIAGSINGIRNKLRAGKDYFCGENSYAQSDRESFIRLSKTMEGLLSSTCHNFDVSVEPLLSKEADSVLVISKNQEPVPYKETDEQTDTREPAWKSLHIFIPQDANDTLSIELWNYKWLNEKIAEGTITGTIPFLKMLCDGFIMTPVEDEEEYFQNGGARLVFKSLDFDWPRDAHGLIERFLVPGTYWQE